MTCDIASSVSDDGRRQLDDWQKPVDALLEREFLDQENGIQKIAGHYSIHNLENI